MATVCVIGAGGFIASWLVAKLLEKGYKVHGTVRNPDDDVKCGHLRALDGASERLTLFKADVLDYESLVPAIRGCQGVFHTACPLSLKFENPDDVLLPAIKGTENVMKACREEHVKRVVMTSSASAITSDPNRPEDRIVDESCWSDSESCKERKSWYSLAKTESEKLAWKMSKELKQDLVTICPVLAIGPMLHSSLNASADLFNKIMTGEYPENFLNIVDVRDTAEIHILAFENPEASGRYFCMNKLVGCNDLRAIIRKNFPHVQVVDKEWTGVIPNNRSNKKVLELIGEFLPVEQSVVDATRSLLEKHEVV